VNSQPAPPVNVRVVLDGTEIPVECVYAGRAVDGYHQWCAVTPIDTGDAMSAYVLIDELPDNTSVTIAVKEEF
jgi:hypothetical protein